MSSKYVHFGLFMGPQNMYILGMCGVVVKLPMKQQINI